MSVEKVDFQKLIKEQIPYTLVYTKVIQNISDPLAGFIWIYLLSLPPEWKINKKHLKKHFNIGDDRLKDALAYLRRANLIEYVQERCAKGTIAQWAINVLCGDKFVENQELKEVHTTGVKNHSVANHSSGFRPPIKEIKNKENKKHKLNISCAPDDAPTLFELFWVIYPLKKNRKRSYDIWKRKRYDEIATLIMEDIHKRKKIDHQWQDKKYIPHPSTYLNDRLWEDEVVVNTSKNKHKSNGSAFSDFISNTGATYDECGREINPFD